jgi:hypothetical protein
MLNLMLLVWMVFVFVVLAAKGIGASVRDLSSSAADLL